MNDGKTFFSSLWITNEGESAGGLKKQRGVEKKKKLIYFSLHMHFLNKKSLKRFVYSELYIVLYSCL